MATKIPVPKLGQSEETVTIASWRVKEGDKIKKGDVLFEVETDKAVLEVESQFEGTILKIVTPVGVEVPVMTTTAAIVGEPGEQIPADMLAAAPAAASVTPTTIHSDRPRASPVSGMTGSSGPAGGFGSSGSTGGFGPPGLTFFSATFISKESETPLPSCAAAVIRTVPLPTAFTLPFSSTVAIFSSDDVQTRPLSSAPAGRTTADSFWLSPTSISFSP